MAEVISSILHLPISEHKSIHSVSKGRRVAGDHHHFSPQPRAVCHGLFSLRRYCQATVQGNKISAPKTPSSEVKPNRTLFLEEPPLNTVKLLFL